MSVQGPDVALTAERIVLAAAWLAIRYVDLGIHARNFGIAVLEIPVIGSRDLAFPKQAG